MRGLLTLEMVVELANAVIACCLRISGQCRAMRRLDMTGVVRVEVAPHRGRWWSAGEGVTDRG